MGPFTLIPGFVQKVDFAYVSAMGDNGPISSISLLKEYVDFVKEEYFKDSDYFGYQWLGTEDFFVENPKLEVYPNPASTEIWVNYNAAGRSVTFTLTDIFGREIESGQKSPNGKFNIPISHLRRGIYILNIVDNKKLSTAKVLVN